MTIARRKQFRLDVTPYYHCVTRCVRRAFICGRDELTKRNFNHRKEWIEQRLLLLSKVFCIDLASYAILSNHYHVVLHVDQLRADSLSDLEVIARWHRLYKGPNVIKKYLSEGPLTELEMEAVRQTVALWREQLTNISRFMGNLNESIARRANKEDDCTGRFWESRFKLQAILDLKALLRTLCYVDLNPVRAKVAKTPETSLHTSVRRRLKLKGAGLMPFVSKASKRIRPDDLPLKEIPITLKDYLSLLDFTGKVIRHDKRGFIEQNLPSIFKRMGYSFENWKNFQSSPNKMYRADGNPASIKAYCKAIGQKWIWQAVR